LRDLSILASILMHLPYFDVHAHVGDDVKIIIKLRLIAKVHFVGLHYIITGVPQFGVQKIKFATARQTTTDIAF